MGDMVNIVILHPGAMGVAVAQDLRDAGHVVGWLPEGRGKATVARATAAGLQPWPSLSGVNVAVSLVPPAFSVTTAQRVAGFSGLYLDANAISPERAAEVAGIVRAGGATYVDGAVVGPPPIEKATTRLFLSGAAASGTADLFAGTRLETVVCSEEFGASAVKMAYASWTKISAALIIAAEQTAQAYGVVDELHAEWRRSQLDLKDRLDQARTDAAEKGWRWVDEMHQIARTFAAAESPAEFGNAAASVFGRYPRP